MNPLLRVLLLLAFAGCALLYSGRARSVKSKAVAKTTGLTLIALAIGQVVRFFFAKERKADTHGEVIEGELVSEVQNERR